MFVIITRLYACVFLFRKSQTHGGDDDEVDFEIAACDLFVATTEEIVAGE